jgi:thioredoxin reductase
LWLKNLGLEPVVVERQDAPGGMPNLNFLDNDWVLGHAGVTGQTLGRRFSAHARRAGVNIRLGVRSAVFLPGSDAMTLHLGEGDELRCAALVIATGTRHRGLEILENPLDAAVAARVFCGPYAFADIDGQAGKHVLIVGGGDNAYENARLLLAHGARVTLVSRSRRRARRQMWEPVVGQGACTIHEESRLLDLAAKQGISCARVGGANGEWLMDVDRVHILAGYAPNTKFLADFLPGDWYSALRFDAEGYLCVDAWGRTAIPGIYAAGDVCNPAFPSIVSALAQGAKTAKAIAQDLAHGPPFQPKPDEAT